MVAPRKKLPRAGAVAPKGECVHVRRTYDYVIAGHSLKWKHFTDGGGGRPRLDAAQSSILLRSRETRRSRNGMSRGFRRCSLVTVEEGCQEEARRKEAEKKRKKKKTAKEDK